MKGLSLVPTEPHLTRARLEEYLRTTERPWQRGILFHLMERCPTCKGVGTDVLEAFERGDFSTDASIVEIETAMLEARAPAEFARFERMEPGPGKVAALGETEQGHNYWGWAAYLSQASTSLAASDPSRALELARLGADIAERLVDDEPAPWGWNLALKAYAWAALGNAARAAQVPSLAASSFHAAGRYLRGELDEGTELRFYSRAFDLRASHHRDARDARRALADLDSAIRYAPLVTVRPEPDHPCRLFLKKSLVLIELGDPSEALATLAEAAEALNGLPPSRLTFAILANTLYATIEIGDLVAARALLPDVQAAADEHGTELDRIRIRWQEGRLLRETGALEDAATVLSAVYDAFAKRRLARDTALVVLELSEVLLHLDQSDQVRDLARRAAVLFKTQSMEGEYQALLALYWKAAEDETLELTAVKALGKLLQNRYASY